MIHSHLDGFVLGGVGGSLSTAHYLYASKHEERIFLTHFAFHFWRLFLFYLLDLTTHNDLDITTASAWSFGEGA